MTLPLWATEFERQMAALEDLLVSPLPESEWLSRPPDETPVPIALDLIDVLRGLDGRKVNDP